MLRDKKTVGKYHDNSIDGDSSIEVEAKIIARVIRTQSRENRPGRNTWNIMDGAEGGDIIKQYVRTHYIDNDELFLIDDDDELDDFFQLQENFQSYYIEYADEGQLENYKQGAERTKPKVYNYLMNATTSNNQE